MSKKFFYILIAALLAPVCGASAYPGELTALEETHKVVSDENLRLRIQFFTDSICGGRATGSRGAQEAAFMIAREFSDIGLVRLNKGYFHSFSASPEVAGHNVIGMLKGSNQPSGSYVIVMTHYDGTGTLGGVMYPGADANASGIVSMLSIARMFSTMIRRGANYSKNILFVALDAKSWSLRGSEALWDIISEGGLTDPSTGRAITPERITTVINIDQIGSNLSPIHRDRKDYLLAVGLQKAIPWGQLYLEAINMKYGFNLDLCYDYYGSQTFTSMFYNRISNHRHFLEHKVPCVLFTSGITMNTNRTTDTPESLDLDLLGRRTILIFHLTERLCF